MIAELKHVVICKDGFFNMHLTVMIEYSCIYLNVSSTNTDAYRCRPLVKSVYQKLIFLFLNQNIIWALKT